jgi:hypothetical protein
VLENSKEALRPNETEAMHRMTPWHKMATHLLRVRAALLHGRMPLAHWLQTSHWQALSTMRAAPLRAAPGACAIVVHRHSAHDARARHGVLAGAAALHVWLWLQVRAGHGVWHWLRPHGWHIACPRHGRIAIAWRCHWPALRATLAGVRVRPDLGNVHVLGHLHLRPRHVCRGVRVRDRHGLGQ